MTDGLVLDAPPGLPVITGTRDFAAPPRAVFRAWVDPELVVQWLGPARYTMHIDHWDARSGGAYRYVHRDASASFAFHGSFHTVRPDELLVQTFEYEGAPDSVSLDTIRFVDTGGRTRTEQLSIFPSVEARDAMLAAGMEGGLSEGLRRLDVLLSRSGSN